MALRAPHWLSFWVAEANNYPDKLGGGKDRLIILEDTDGDGRHDERVVFYDKLEYVSGIEVGFGGMREIGRAHV